MAKPARKLKDAAKDPVIEKRAAQTHPSKKVASNIGGKLLLSIALSLIAGFAGGIAASRYLRIL